MLVLKFAFLNKVASEKVVVNMRYTRRIPMRLSVFLKTISDLRKEIKNEKKTKATDWIKDFFISAGAYYLAQEENEKKTFTLLRHVFSPALGRSTLPPELTDILLESKTQLYWCAFKYLLDNIEWETNIEKINNIVVEIVNDENLYCKKSVLGFSPLGSDNYRCLDINTIMTFQNYNDDLKKRVIFDFILGYFYHLVRWDVVVSSKFGERFEYQNYRPYISSMLGMHHDLGYANGARYSDKPIISISPWGYANLTYNVGTKRLYFPRKELTMKSFYSTENYELFSESTQSYYETDTRYYSMSSDCSYFSYIDQDYILLWNLIDASNEIYSYKILKEHGINIDNNSIKSLSFNDSNDIIIHTNNASYYISTKEFNQVEPLFRLGEDDYIIDEDRQIFIRDNILYKFRFSGEHEKIFDLAEFADREASLLFDPTKKEIHTDNLEKYIIQCKDSSVWAIDINRKKKVNIIEKQKAVLTEYDHLLSEFSSYSANRAEILQMIFSKSKNFALVFWKDTEKNFCGSIVDFKDMKSKKEILFTEKELYNEKEKKSLFAESGTIGDNEFFIQFRIEKSKSRALIDYILVMKDGKVDITKTIRNSSDMYTNSFLKF